MKITACMVLLIIVTDGSAQSQLQLPESDTTRFVYCELVGTGRLFSNKVTVQVDFGERARFFSSDRVLKDKETGQPIVFNSMVDALNHMGDDGWEFVQAYVVTMGQQNVYHWLLKRRRHERIN